MELKTYFAQDRNGNLIPSAHVSIYLTGTTTLASGLTTTGGSALANPFTADADGKIQFRAPNGIYDMQVSVGTDVGTRVTFQCIDINQMLADASSAAENAAESAADAEAAAGSLSDISAVAGLSSIGSASYADIRAYSGDGDTIQCYGRTHIFDGASGIFRRDDSDTTSADNDGTIIVDASGRRWKRDCGRLMNVKWFGAAGNWNVTTQSGNDDTAPFQAALNAMQATFREAGVCHLYAPGGNYKITSVTIPASIEFGLEIYGDGMFSTFIWADHTNTDPAFMGQIELVHFHDIALWGSLSQQQDTTKWKPSIYQGKHHNKAPDVDVRFSNVYFGSCTDFIQAYGRGVVVENSCVGAFYGWVLNIVCDPSIVFPGGPTNSAKTGMRNYDISPQRVDAGSRLIRVTGTAVCKDYIHNISVRGVQLLSADRIIEFEDATIRGLYITGVNALMSFTTGLVVGKRLISSSIEINTAKQYDRDTASTQFMTGIVTLTGPCSGLTIRGNFRDLVGYAVQVGAVSSGIKLDIQVENLASDGQAFIAVKGANVVGIDANIIATGAAPAGAMSFVDANIQTDPKLKCNAYGANFARAYAPYTPNLLVGGTNQTPAGRVGRYRVENGEAIVDAVYSYNRAATTTSEVSLTLPVTPAVEFPGYSTISGSVAIKDSSLATIVRGKIVPGSSSVVFYKPDGTTVKEADLPSVFYIAISARYPV